VTAAWQLRDGDVFSIHTFKFQYLIERAPAVLSLDLDRSRAAGLGRLGGPRLVVVAGPDLGQIFPLWGEQITMGRASLSARKTGSRSELPVTWEIRLTDKSVSRPHARLERREDCFYLLDLESANGTLLNGSPVLEPAPLAEGDLIVVGETHLRFFLQ
jgi:pSer/pThr/pTyr-binding forkhead associated (FHA) protein